MPLGGGPVCGVCKKNVYFNEERRAIGKVFHTSCFKCEKCGKGLDSFNCAEHGDRLFCKNCHRQQFGPSGYGFAAGGAGLSTMDGVINSKPASQGSSAAISALNNVSATECCPTCSKRVYFAEQILALGRKWHKLCFKCSRCGKNLDSYSVTEHENCLFCKSCYSKKFGPKGYGFAGGSAGLSTESGQPRQPGTVPTGPSIDKDHPECCPRCGRRVYFAEQVLALNRKWHKLCFKCANCNKTVDSTSATDHEGELFCKSCHSRRFGPKGVGYGIGAGTLSSA